MLADEIEFLRQCAVFAIRKVITRKFLHAPPNLNRKAEVFLYYEKASRPPIKKS